MRLINVKFENGIMVYHGFRGKYSAQSQENRNNLDNTIRVFNVIWIAKSVTLLINVHTQEMTNVSLLFGDICYWILSWFFCISAMMIIYYEKGYLVMPWWLSFMHNLKVCEQGLGQQQKTLRVWRLLSLTESLIIWFGHWWIPRTKASDAERWCFLWSAPK